MKARVRNSLYLLSLTPAICVIAGNATGGWLAGLNFYYSLLFLAALEWVLPKISSNEASRKNDRFPMVVILLHIPAQTLCILSLILGIYSGTLKEGWVILAALSTGINSGSSAIVCAHELIHRKSSFDKLAGKYLLFSAGNPYFYIEHLKVHHKWAATKRDPASAYLGESIYAFVFRSAFNQFIGAIEIENNRLGKKRQQNFLLNHYVYRQIILHILVLVILFYVGIWLAIAWIFQCIVAGFLLEYVNYIQHYGMERQLKGGASEHYSWDSDRFISRFVLVDLSRHSDHHHTASKPYHTLETFSDCPKLPGGYAGLFFLVILPPVWFGMMNKRIEAFRKVK